MTSLRAHAQHRPPAIEMKKKKILAFAREIKTGLGRRVERGKRGANKKNI
jgi:hypothetical protein